MSEIDGGGSAFPVTPTDNSGQIGPTEYGLTKREWYAGMALQGLITGCYVGDNAGFTVQGNVVAAYEYADAMIRAGKVQK
jgi:hypothetical protein